MRRTLTSKSIVLDLDETLVRTMERISDLVGLGILDKPELMDLRKRTYLVNLDSGPKRIKMWGIMRPYLREFLVFCFAYFKVVAVWSAGTREYVHEVVRKIFSEVGSPHIVMTRNDVTMTGKETRKPLSRIIAADPVLKENMSLASTFILEDRLTSYNSTDPGNGILIPGYSPPPTIERLRAMDISLKQLMKWLKREDVMSSDDVRKLDKSSIFFAPLEESGA